MARKLRPRKRMRSSATVLYTIADRGRVADLVERHHVLPAGRQAEAARRLGLSQSLLSKLRNKDLKSIRQSTLEAIGKHMPEGVREELLNAVQSPSIRDSLRRYDKWLEENLAKHLAGKTRPQWSISNTADLLAHLERDEAYAKHFNDFSEWVRRRWGDSPETERRIELAKHQVLTPLVQVNQSGGIEPQAGEMHERKDLGPYLRAALSAARRLLNRQPAVERLRRVEARSTVVMEWRGPERPAR